jgi:hypothetical protein
MAPFLKRTKNERGTSLGNDNPWDQRIRRITQHRWEDIIHHLPEWYEKYKNRPPTTHFNEWTSTSTSSATTSDPGSKDIPGPEGTTPLAGLTGKELEEEKVEIDAELEVAVKVTIPPLKAAMVPCHVPVAVAQACRVGRQMLDDTLLHATGGAYDPDKQNYFLLIVQNDANTCRTLRKHSKLPIRFIQQKEPPVGLTQDPPDIWEQQWNEMADLVVMQSDNLDNDGKTRLRKMLVDYKDVFRLKTDPPGCVSEYAVPIQLTTQTPVCQPQYHLSAADNKESDRQVELMLKAGVIRPSTSPYNFPRLFTDKKVITNEGTEVPDR